MIWDADNTIWLLPAYTFGTADGGLYTVIAVDDAFIQQADPDTTTTRARRRHRDRPHSRRRATGRRDRHRGCDRRPARPASTTPATTAP